MAEAVRTLRAAAAGEGVQAAQVDGAVQRLHDGRERLARLDAELLAEVSSGATPDRKARAALFLAHFRSRGGPAAGGYPPANRPNRPPGATAVPDRPYVYGPPGTPPPPAGAARPPVAQPMPGGAPPAPPPAPPAPEPGDEGPELEDWFSGE